MLLCPCRYVVMSLVWTRLYSRVTEASLRLKPIFDMMKYKTIQRMQPLCVRWIYFPLKIYRGHKMSILFNAIFLKKDFWKKSEMILQRYIFIHTSENIAVEIWSGTERKPFPIMQISVEIEFRLTKNSDVYLIQTWRENV